MRSSQKFPTPRGVMEGQHRHPRLGPGRVARQLQRHRRHPQLRRDHARSTPTAASCGSTSAFKTMGDEETTRNVGRAFVAEVDKQVREDKPIWEHKAHLVRPALADTDGPFMKFRKWAAQFYAEPVGDDRLVYPPPYWPDRVDDAPAKATASARHMGAGRLAPAPSDRRRMPPGCRRRPTCG